MNKTEIISRAVARAIQEMKGYEIGRDGFTRFGDLKRSTRSELGRIFDEIFNKFLKKEG